MKQKLIDQLIHKAGARFGGDGINYDLFVPSKFAELIVRECAEICLEANDHKNILRHFGVEE